MKSKRNDILRTLMLLGIILTGSFVLSTFFFKIDLTQEQRHSLAEPTVDMLQNMDDNMFIRCYLHGDFPAEYKHLEQSIRDIFIANRAFHDAALLAQAKLAVMGASLLAALLLGTLLLRRR